MAAPRPALLVLAALAGGAMPIAAQTPLTDGLRLEREGRYEEAVQVYRAALAAEPANVTALVGLERMYTELGRLDSLPPLLESAVAADPTSDPVRAIQFRVLAGVRGADSARAAAERWIAARPTSATPYREWAFWHAQRGDTSAALEVVERGRVALGAPAMAPHAAALHRALGEWLLAAMEWRVAVITDEAELGDAVAELSRAPVATREPILRMVLDRALRPVERRYAADLLLEWERPEEAWTLLDGALPRDPGAAAAALWRFVERARRFPTPDAARARGFALERLAEYTSGAEAARARLEAARAFADAGELGSAQRLLDRLPARPPERPTDDRAAMATFIRVLAEAGRVQEAEVRYQEWAARLSPDDAAALRETLAWAWILQAEVRRAEELLARDSSVGAAAVLGWAALYRGELEQARSRFRAAGPYARSREEATRRSRMLALIERIAAPQAPELGSALLDLARGDTLKAAERLAVAARRLPARGGRADVLALAGEAAGDARAYAMAAPLLREALTADSQGPAAPAALYALAAIAAAQGHPDRAAAYLERLILSYRESALVPQARRLLDQVRGMIPSS